jgi:hypothetical protein
MEAQIAKNFLYTKLQVLHGSKKKFRFGMSHEKKWEFMRIHYKLT